MLRCGVTVATITYNDENGTRHFILNEEEEFTTEKEKELDFDQLNALRRFWLETRDEE